MTKPSYELIKALDKLIEECAEVIQCATKIKRFGPTNFHPDTKIYNSIAMIEELKHLDQAAQWVMFEMPRPSVTRMAEEMYETLKKEDEAIQQEFATTKFEELALYHSSLGRDIRNTFKLWAYPWEPELDENGVDVSQNHPDAISMRVIEEVWRKANND